MTERPRSFQEVLSAAIDDMLANGFDSIERVDRWTRELRMAAERDMISEVSMEQQLRDALSATYRRLVDGNEIARYNPGVERFTLDRIRPKLRAELDRRIMASANLIRLNRGQAIDKTLQRFQGWSTSIPIGGVSGEKKRDVKANVKKSVGALPFEERRVLIDQGHKLVSAINEIVAADGGAIAVIWRSHWRQPGYNYREDHKERDNEFFLIRDSWADKTGYVKKAGRKYYDEVEAFGQLPFCRCYGIYQYALRDLPDDMLTAKGREALAIARAQLNVHSARTARADDANVNEVGGATKASVAYIDVWPSKVTRCQRCEMFVRLKGTTMGNACRSVDGEISAHGHCTLFFILGARTDSVDDDDPAPKVGPAADILRLERLKTQLEDIASGR